MVDFDLEPGPSLVQRFLSEWQGQVPALRQAGVLQSLWRWWLRRQLLLALRGETEAVAEESGEALDQACLVWAEQRWAEQLEREFLARQHNYHRIRFSQLRVESKDLAQELGFQLRERETDFPELNFRFGQAPERKRGGLMPDLPLSAIAPPMAKVLQRLQPGEVAGPLRLPPYFLLLRLDAFIPAVLDEDLSRQLLLDLLEEWLQGHDAQLQAALQALDQPAASSVVLSPAHT